MTQRTRRIMVLLLTLALCFVQVLAPAAAEELAADNPPPEAGSAASVDSEAQTEAVPAAVKTSAADNPPPEAGSSTTTVTSPEGLTVTTTTTTSENGDGTVTVTIEKNTEGTTHDGVKVSGSETTENTYDGLQVDWEKQGSETREWTEEDDGNDSGQTPVSVDLDPGEVSYGEVVIETLEGDVPDGPEDATYDFTETEMIDRQVSVTTSDDVVITENGGDVDLTAIGPDIYTEDGSFATGDYQLGQYSDGEVKEGIYTTDNASDLNYHETMEWDEEKGEWVPVDWTGEGDFQYAGYAEQSKTQVHYHDDIVYETDADGNLVLDENGNAVIESSTPDYSNPIQFVLHDQDGNVVYAYCLDLETSAAGGHYYDVSNLEDSDYYASEESENHLRAIVTNGYWGSANTQDEDGNYATGSIEAIRAGLADAFADGTLADEETDITDENGNAVMLSELMAGITEGEALACTQAAIWAYANGNPDIIAGTASEIVVGEDGFSGDDASRARLKAYYNYLIGLTAEKTETTVIDDETFLKEDSLNLVVGDKSSGHSRNYDDDDDNDVYDTSLNFTLAFIPGEKDDLLVCVSYKDLDGNDQTIVKRLAGENGEGQAYETIYADTDGSYTLSGLTLSENKEFNFDLKLEGVQYLEQGVYVYSPVGGRDASQTFVSLAEGSREVDVTTELTISFDVNEDNRIVATRKWSDRGTYTRTPSGGEVPGDDPDGGDDPSDSDEEALLADAPETGDISIVYALVSLLSLCGILLLARKLRAA